MPWFTPHDLRRTAATHIASFGTQPWVISRLLNHKEGETRKSTTARYSYDVEKWELHNHRHALLQQRDLRGSSIVAINMELNVVRSELQALYEDGRKPPPQHPSAQSPLRCSSFEHALR